MEAGLAAYREGAHYEAHEHWEAIWLEEEDDDERRFLQALIQIASAMHKLVHHVEPRGSLRLLERALEKLEGLADDYGGIALGPLREGARRCLADAAPKIAAGERVKSPLIPPIERAPAAS